MRGSQHVRYISVLTMATLQAEPSRGGKLGVHMKRLWQGARLLSAGNFRGLTQETLLSTSNPTHHHDCHYYCDSSSITTTQTRPLLRPISLACNNVLPLFSNPNKQPVRDIALCHRVVWNQIQFEVVIIVGCSVNDSPHSS